MRYLHICPQKFIILKITRRMIASGRLFFCILFYIYDINQIASLISRSHSQPIIFLAVSAVFLPAPSPRVYAASHKQRHQSQGCRIYR